MKKFLLCLIVLCLFVSPNALLATATVEDFFSLEAPEAGLFIRPLKSADKEKAWTVENSGEEQKFVCMFAQDDDEAAPDHIKLSPAFAGQERLLKRPVDSLQDRELMAKLKPGQKDPGLYLGVFEQDSKKHLSRNQHLVGVINLHGFTEVGENLWFEYMFDQSSRGKGYGTTSIKTLELFLQQQNYVPKNSTDAGSKYAALKAKVDFENKASLAVLYRKCGFKPISFHGCFIELAYPGPADEDNALMPQLQPLLTTYLAPPPVAMEEVPSSKKTRTKERQAPKKVEEPIVDPVVVPIEEQLIRLSFANLIAMSVADLEDAMQFEDNLFLVDNLTKFPGLFELLDSAHRKFFQTSINRHYRKNYYHYESEDDPIFDGYKERFVGVLKRFREANKKAKQQTPASRTSPRKKPLTK